MRLNKLALATTLVLGNATLAMAEDAVRINGFANFTGGITSSDESQLGFDDSVDFTNGSLIGLQFTGKINDKTTATAQVIARGDDGYAPRFEWAYITYQFTDNLSITGGHFRMPLFNYSESTDIGYSYHWMSTPSSVYNSVFDNIDGVKVDFTSTLGNWDSLTTVAFGNFKTEALGTQNNGDDVVVASYELSNEEWRLRGVIGQAAISIDLTQSSDAATASLGGGFNAINALGLNELSDNLQINGDTGQFYGLSAGYDNSDYFVTAEITRITIDETFLNEDTAYYVTLGKRIGKWTPALTYEKFESSGDVKYQDQIDGISLATLPPEVIAQLTGVAIGSQMAQQDEYSIVSATIRYEYDTNVALKAEVTQRTDDVNENGDSTLFRVGVAYVF